jgi:hypothetical protein
MRSNKLEVHYRDASNRLRERVAQNLRNINEDICRRHREEHWPELSKSNKKRKR